MEIGDIMQSSGPKQGVVKRAPSQEDIVNSLMLAGCSLYRGGGTTIGKPCHPENDGSTPGWMRAVERIIAQLLAHKTTLSVSQCTPHSGA